MMLPVIFAQNASKPLFSLPTVIILPNMPPLGGPPGHGRPPGPPLPPGYVCDGPPQRPPPPTAADLDSNGKPIHGPSIPANCHPDPNSSNSESSTDDSDNSSNTTPNSMSSQTGYIIGGVSCGVVALIGVAYVISKKNQKSKIAKKSHRFSSDSEYGFTPEQLNKLEGRLTYTDLHSISVSNSSSV
eukprot:NODE_299_length_10456_cov_1.003669.p8 type:complete len:186 gc:universal NODE_299_length_10456_cov_1.003669:1455-898(-)